MTLRINSTTLSGVRESDNAGQVSRRERDRHWEASVHNMVRASRYIRCRRLAARRLEIRRRGLGVHPHSTGAAVDFRVGRWKCRALDRRRVPAVTPSPTSRAAFLTNLTQPPPTPPPHRHAPHKTCAWPPAPPPRSGAAPWSHRNRPAFSLTAMPPPAPFRRHSIGPVAPAYKLWPPLCELGHIFREANRPKVVMPSHHGVSP